MSNNPLSIRRKEDSRLLDLMKESFQVSDRIYGSACIFCDLKEPFIPPPTALPLKPLAME
jgi:hypothetical protein